MSETEIQVRFIRSDLEGDQTGWTHDPIIGHYKEVTIPVLYGRSIVLPAELATCQTIVITQTNNPEPGNAKNRRYTSRKGDALYSNGILTVTFNGSYKKAVDFYYKAQRAFAKASRAEEAQSHYWGGLSPP